MVAPGRTRSVGCNHWFLRRRARASAPPQTAVTGRRARPAEAVGAPRAGPGASGRVRRSACRAGRGKRGPGRPPRRQRPRRGSRARQFTGPGPSASRRPQTPRLHPSSRPKLCGESTSGGRRKTKPQKAGPNRSDQLTTQLRSRRAQALGSEVRNIFVQKLLSLLRDSRRERKWKKTRMISLYEWPGKLHGKRASPGAKRARRGCVNHL